MKKLTSIIQHFWPRHRDADPGVLLWVHEAHTVVPWKLKYGKPPALRVPLTGVDPLTAKPRPYAPIEIGCVSRAMREIAKEVSFFSELLPVHGYEQRSHVVKNMQKSYSRTPGEKFSKSALFVVSLLICVPYIVSYL